MNTKRSLSVAGVSIINSILILYASILGILDKNLYGDLLKVGAISQNLLYGSVAQDIISIPLALMLLGLSVLYFKYRGYKSFIAILGLLCNFFYGYGLYVIQGQYTSIYIVYLIIFSLSIYSLIFGIISFEKDEMQNCRLPRTLQKAIAIFMIIIVIMLGPVWVIRVLSNMISHSRSETYGVFILDLCIVFPALFYIAIGLLKNKMFFNILGGIGIFKALTVCLSWGFGQWYVTLYNGLPIDYPMTLVSTILTIISFVFSLLYILKLKKEDEVNV